MTILKITPLRAAVLLGLSAFALAGCQSGMTYGTGKSPGMQTLQDVVGIAALTNEKPEPIDYKPRAPIVAPPVVGALPPPVDPTSTGSVVAANWPVDPDLQRQAIKDEIARREAAGEPLPDFRLPAGAEPPPPVEDITDGPMTPEEIDRVRRQFAEARGVMAVDTNGNPVRRYLTDPPSEYRVPDAASPTQLAEMPKKKRKFLFWEWEQSR